MKKSNKLWIIIGIIATIIMLSVIAFYIQKNNNTIISNSIQQDLLEPYVELLQNQKFDIAYQKYTSEDYKKKYTLAKYIASQDSNYIANGKIIKITPVSNIFIKEVTSKDLTVFKGTFNYESEKTKKKILIEIIKEDNLFKINRTYDSYLTISDQIPTIY